MAVLKHFMTVAQPEPYDSLMIAMQVSYLRWGPLSTLLLSALVSPAAAQGDDCSNPEFLTGTGTYTLATTALTHSGHFGAQPCAVGVSNIFSNADKFYAWTAPFAGDFVFDTVGSVGSTEIAAFDGSGCGAACLAYNHYFNGDPAAISVSGLAAGDVVMLQIGFDVFGPGAPGTLHIFGAPADPFEDNDTVATASPMGPGLHTGLWASYGDPDYYAIDVPVGHRMVMLETADSADAQYSLFGWSGTGHGAANPEGAVFVNEGATSSTVIVRAITAAYDVPYSFYDLDVLIEPTPCLSPDTFEDNDTCVEAKDLGPGLYLDLEVSDSDPDYFTFCVEPGATVTADIAFLGLASNLDLRLRRFTPFAGCGSLLDESAQFATDAEQVQWTNPGPMVVRCVLEVSVWPFSNSLCSSYQLHLAGASLCDLSGFPICDPMDPNSTGMSTTLVGSYDPAATSGLHLEVLHGPPGEFGYLLLGSSWNDPGVVISQGRLCFALTAGNFFVRYTQSGTEANSIGVFDDSGQLMNLAGTSSTGTGFDVPETIPLGSMLVIQRGELWTFQAWHRDSGAGVGESNFSNGLVVTF